MRPQGENPSCATDAAQSVNWERSAAGDGTNAGREMLGSQRRVADRQEDFDDQCEKHDSDAKPRGPLQPLRHALRSLTRMRGLKSSGMGGSSCSSCLRSVGRSAAGWITWLSGEHGSFRSAPSTRHCRPDSGQRRAERFSNGSRTRLQDLPMARGTLGNPCTDCPQARKTAENPSSTILALKSRLARRAWAHGK